MVHAALEAVATGGMLDQPADAVDFGLLGSFFGSLREMPVPNESSGFLLRLVHLFRCLVISAFELCIQNTERSTDDAAAVLRKLTEAFKGACPDWVPQGAQGCSRRTLGDLTRSVRIMADKGGALLDVSGFGT